MIPGLTTKISEVAVASATTIDQKADLLRVTGTTAIATIRPNLGGGFSGVCFIVPVDGSVATTTAGNIAKVLTMVINQVTVLVYSKATGKWYPGAIS